jgi:hypothetical protein
VLTATVLSGRQQEGDERCAVLTINSRGETARSSAGDDGGARGHRRAPARLSFAS